MRKLTVSFVLAAATLGIAAPAAASTGGSTPPADPVPYVARHLPNDRVQVSNYLDQVVVFRPAPYIFRPRPVVTLDPGVVIKCLTPPPGISKAEYLEQLKQAGTSPPPVIC